MWGDLVIPSSLCSVGMGDLVKRSKNCRHNFFPSDHGIRTPSADGASAYSFQISPCPEILIGRRHASASRILVGMGRLGQELVFMPSHKNSSQPCSLRPVLLNGCPLLAFESPHDSYKNIVAQCYASHSLFFVGMGRLELPILSEHGSEPCAYTVPPHAQTHRNIAAFGKL
jgi:hypothetical protein